MSYNQSDVEVDIRARIGKAASTFQRLGKIWSSHSINLDTKLRLYTSIVIPTGLHACETWKSTFNIRQKLDVFHQRCLRTFLGISWRDHISNDEVLRRVDLGSLSEIVRQKRLRFAGHILRLPENRPAYKAMNWLPDNGKRRPGRPTKTWRATFKEDLQDIGLTWMGAKRSAATDQNGESSSPDVRQELEELIRSKVRNLTVLNKFTPYRPLLP